MDSKKLLLLGITGYIGGQVALHLLQKHPQIQMTAMVRNESQFVNVQAVFPSIRLVKGDLQSHDVLKEECAKSDIIVNCATADDIKAISAMLDSLQSSVRPQPVYFIHTSGTGIIDDVPNGYGRASPNVFDDIKDIQKITSWPETHWHRVVDKVVLEAAQVLDGEMPKSIIKTAIICPPTVYGTGDGPIRKRSVQIPELIRLSIQRQKAFQVGPGQNTWHHIHVADLADAYVLLIEEAYQDEGRADWSGKGYHFAEAGKHTFGEVAHFIAHTLHTASLIPTEDVESLSVNEVREINPMGHKIWGSNARATASRLRKLGWQPSRSGWKSTIGDAVEMEVQFLKTN